MTRDGIFPTFFLSGFECSTFLWGKEKRRRDLADDANVVPGLHAPSAHDPERIDRPRQREGAVASRTEAIGHARRRGHGVALRRVRHQQDRGIVRDIVHVLAGRQDEAPGRRGRRGRGARRGRPGTGPHQEQAEPKSGLRE